MNVLIVFVLGCVATLSGVIMMRNKLSLRGSCTIKAMGEIIEVREETPQYDEDSPIVPKPEYFHKVSYEIDGEKFTEEIKPTASALEVGSQIKIYINPKDHKEAAYAGEKEYLPYALIAGGILFMFVSSLFIG